MERPKKEIPSEPKAEPKAEPLKLLAWFKAIDEDGDKTKMKYESKGMTLQEAVENLEFPKALNCLVNLEVSRGDKKAIVALAPHNARRILENKAWQILGESFRKI